MTRDKDRDGMKARCLVSRVLLAVLLLSGVCVAGAQNGEPAANVPLVVPMETVSGHFVVVLEDRLLGKLRLVVDTGAERTLLSGKAAAKAKVDRHFTDPFYSFYGFGQGKKAKLEGHTKLELGSAQRTLATIDAFVVDGGNLNVGVQSV